MNITNNKNEKIKCKYTKDYFIEFIMKNTKSKYIFRTIDDIDYLIVEWKSGDYIMMVK